MRLIDADSVKRGIEELKQSPWYNEKYLDHFPIRKEAVEVIEHLCIDKEPSIDAVPVVRCRECKVKDEERCPWWHGVPADEFYCAWGERKDNE